MNLFNPLKIKEDILMNRGFQTVDGSHEFHSMKQNGSEWCPKTILLYQHFSKYFLFCSAKEIDSYKFGTT